MYVGACRCPRPVVGGSDGDLAFIDHFDDESVPAAWFHPDLVEYIDHAEGTRARIGDTRLLVRGSAGNGIRWRRKEASVRPLLQDDLA